MDINEPLDIVRDGHLGGYVRGGDPGTWCPHLWRWAVETFDVRSVLDVGCGEAHSTRFFQRQGCHVWGVDGCRQAVADSVLPDRVALHDFNDGPFDAPRRFDMIWSCEFLEHVDECYLPNILQTFAQSSKVILITHATPGQDQGHHHVNCRPSRYWIRRLASIGFRCDVEATRQGRAVTLQDDVRVNHFARSGLVFLRQGTSQGRGETADTAWRAGWQATRVNLVFRLSPAFRQHKRQRRMRKREQRRRRAA